MEITLDGNGKVIKRVQDTWADRNPDAVIDTFLCSDLRIALKARNKRKKELKAKGFTDITSESYVDDLRYNPPRTVGYIVSAFK